MINLWKPLRILKNFFFGKKHPIFPNREEILVLGDNKEHKGSVGLYFEILHVGPVASAIIIHLCSVEDVDIISRCITHEILHGWLLREVGPVASELLDNLEVVEKDKEIRWLALKRAAIV